MDFVDIFLYLGSVGVIAVIVFLVYIFRESKENFKSDQNAIRMLGFLLMIAFASLTGHVLFMTTSGWYFVLVCCFNMTYKTEEIGGKNETNY